MTVLLFLTGTIGSLAGAGTLAADSTPGIDFAHVLSSASPALMLAIFILALIRRWLILPRELDVAEKRIVEVEKERDEYKNLLFHALNIGERAVTAAEHEQR